MLKRFLISAIAVLPLPVASSAWALDNQAPSTPIDVSHKPAFQTQCKLLAQAIAQNPKVEEDKIVGTVYSVVGDTVMIEKEDGSLVHVSLSLWERGHMGQLVGRKVVVRNVYCSRIGLAPPPPPVVKPIVVPPLQFSPNQPTVPPLTPRPSAEPAPTPAPQVVPQTW